MFILSLLLLLVPEFNPMTGPQPNVPFRPETPAYYQVNLLNKIKIAKKLVPKESTRILWCKKKIEITKRVGRKIKKISKFARLECGREHALAILNVRTGKIKTLRVGSMYRGQTRPVREFTVTRVTENGVNSEYLVETNDADGKDWAVVALKTMVGDPSRAGKFKPAVYTPYSERLNVTEVRDEGTRHLLKTIGLAYTPFEESNVLSPVSVISPKTILVLLLIEHMDPDEFVRRGPEYMITKVFTTIGANGQEAYRYAISPANARGLAQFIPSTYADTVRWCAKYVKLRKDFAKGMSNHLNAVQAQICLAGRDLDKLLNTDLPRNEPDFAMHKILNCYLAAAYNGGPERAIRSVQAVPALRFKEGSGLARQTVIYVAEFKAVYNYLFSETPIE